MKNTLRFCMVTTFYPPYNFGGDGIYVYRLSNELARQGHYVDIIHCKDAYLMFQTDGPKGDYPDHHKVKIYGLKSRAGTLSPLLTQQTGHACLKGKKIKNIIERNKYDVIHYHNISLIGLSVFKYGKAVKLYTMHEHWLICPMHVLWKFDREVCRKKNCFLCMIRGGKPPQLWRYTGLLKKMLQQVDYFISPSKFTLKKHLEEGLKIKIEHIPDFLPEPEEKKKQDPDTPAKPFFLFVGRIEKIKGAQTLIPVFKKYSQYNLYIAGEGNYAGMLKYLAKDIPNIVFLGRINYDKLQELYSQTIAVIVPSLCCEVFGIIIIEAFAQRTPVIVNHLGALPEIVQKSKGGFSYHSQEELIDCMEKLAKNPKLRHKLGLKGYQAYLKHWSEKNHLAKYLKLIDNIRG